ncbi:hypothetical protein OC835_001125 [Tilletia horrida]|nr:hypothetical protein OC835_001125 [Tilletia horrida]
MAPQNIIPSSDPSSIPSSSQTHGASGSSSGGSGSGSNGWRATNGSSKYKPYYEDRERSISQPARCQWVVNKSGTVETKCNRYYPSLEHLFRHVKRAHLDPILEKNLAASAVSPTKPATTKRQPPGKKWFCRWNKVGCAYKRDFEHLTAHVKEEHFDPYKYACSFRACASFDFEDKIERNEHHNAVHRNKDDDVASDDGGGGVGTGSVGANGTGGRGGGRKRKRLRPVKVKDSDDEDEAKAPEEKKGCNPNFARLYPALAQHLRDSSPLGFRPVHDDGTFREPIEVPFWVECLAPIAFSKRDTPARDQAIRDGRCSPSEPEPFKSANKVPRKQSMSAVPWLPQPPSSGTESDEKEDVDAELFIGNRANDIPSTSFREREWWLQDEGKRPILSQQQKDDKFREPRTSLRMRHLPCRLIRVNRVQQPKPEKGKSRAWPVKHPLLSYVQADDESEDSSSASASASESEDIDQPVEDAALTNRWMAEAKREFKKRDITLSQWHKEQRRLLRQLYPDHPDVPPESEEEKPATRLEASAIGSKTSPSQSRAPINATAGPSRLPASQTQTQTPTTTRSPNPNPNNKTNSSNSSSISTVDNTNKPYNRDVLPNIPKKAGPPSGTKKRADSVRLMDNSQPSASSSVARSPNLVIQTQASTNQAQASSHAARLAKVANQPQGQGLDPPPMNLRQPLPAKPPQPCIVRPQESSSVAAAPQASLPRAPQLQPPAPSRTPSAYHPPPPVQRELDPRPPIPTRAIPTAPQSPAPPAHGRDALPSFPTRATPQVAIRGPHVVAPAHAPPADHLPSPARRDRDPLPSVPARAAAKVVNGGSHAASTHTAPSRPAPAAMERERYGSVSAPVKGRSPISVGDDLKLTPPEQPASSSQLSIYSANRAPNAFDTILQLKKDEERARMQAAQRTSQLQAAIAKGRTAADAIAISDSDDSEDEEHRARDRKRPRLSSPRANAVRMGNPLVNVGSSHRPGQLGANVHAQSSASAALGENGPQKAKIPYGPASTILRDVARGAYGDLDSQTIESVIGSRSGTPSAGGGASQGASSQQQSVLFEAIKQAARGTDSSSSSSSERANGATMSHACATINAATLAAINNQQARLAAQMGAAGGPDDDSDDEDDEVDQLEDSQPPINNLAPSSQTQAQSQTSSQQSRSSSPSPSKAAVALSESLEKAALSAPAKTADQAPAASKVGPWAHLVKPAAAPTKVNSGGQPGQQHVNGVKPVAATGKGGAPAAGASPVKSRSPAKLVPSPSRYQTIPNMFAQAQGRVGSAFGQQPSSVENGRAPGLAAGGGGARVPSFPAPSLFGPARTGAPAASRPALMVPREASPSAATGLQAHRSASTANGARPSSAAAVFPRNLSAPSTSKAKAPAAADADVIDLTMDTDSD